MPRIDGFASVLVAASLAISACKKPAPGKGPPPASMTGKKPEGEIARITLTEQAEQRLGVSLAPVLRSSLPRTRTLGGDVVPSSGRSLVIVAPIAGRLANAGGELRVGQRVRRGDPILRLTPVATVDRDLRSNANRAAAVAESRLTAMEARLARAEKLLPGGAGSARAVEEARAERDSAKAELEAAKSRLGMLERAPLEADVAVTLRAPEDGVVRAVSAPSSTLVPAGAPLFELVGTGALWVKVNVFVGDLRSIRPDAAARVRPLTAPPSASDAEAFPVSGPPTADPATASFDLYFALPPEVVFRPGERVAVTLTYGGETSGATIPTNAVIRDVSGTAWVYEVVSEHNFERRRVEIDRVDGATAHLLRGIAEGARVVAEGSVELYGFEFGSGK
jgi:cobalt-zinc-cadmium efflux system membrane fusion protein